MIREIGEKEYQSLVLDSIGPVIVDFYSTECPPCEALAPKFHFFAELYREEVRFYKVFRQGNRDLANKLGIRSSPTLLFYNNGKEVTSRLTGAIKKADIKRSILSSFGLTDKTHELKREELFYDVAIIGAGPAGLTAAIYTTIAKLSTVVIDKGNSGGTVNITHLVRNYPGTQEPINGYLLMHKMTEQAKATNADIMIAADINGIDLGSKTILIDDDKIIRAKAIIIATGSRPRPLGVPGEKELTGKGISYCATCDGSFYEGKKVYVIGGGNSAVEEALYLTRFVDKLTIIHQFEEFQANRLAVEEVRKNPKIDILTSHEPRAFLGQDSFEKLEVENMKTGERKVLDQADGVFVFVGYEPQTELFKHFVESDQYGYIVATKNMETNIPGIFVAGDVRSKRYRQITTATSDGTIAALAVNEYLTNLDRQ